MDKTSFDWLNKLFVISVGEQDHETLLTNQNLLSLVRDSQSYTVPSLPRFAPKLLVPNEHYVVKDLLFYEEARTADVKARQDRFAKNERKRKKIMLRVVRPPTPLLTLIPRRSLSPGLLRRP